MSKHKKEHRVDVDAFKKWFGSFLLSVQRNRN